MVDFYNPDWDDPALVVCAAAIGRLCNTWARLEMDIATLAGALLQAPNDHITDAMVRCIDFRAQLDLIKVGVIGRDIDPQWEAVIVPEIDYVNDNLRLRRNRYVHDMWVADDDGKLIRIERSNKIGRLQSRQPVELSPVGFNDDTAADIALTTSEINKHGLFIYQVASDLSWPGHGELASRRLSERPPQLLPRLPVGRRHPSGRAGKGP